MAENVLGIDFGTSYCTMCRCNPETGKPEVIRDECGLDKIPSVVYWGPDGDVRVGDAAVAVLQESAAMGPEKGREARARVIASVKRRFFPDRTIALPDGETVAPVEVAAAILKYLKRNAEERCFHGPVRSTTLTHPASFTRAQKTLLEEAGKKAGFETVRLLEEPVAAAMGYAASGAQVGKGVLVYDFGGGTLDLAFVARNEEGEFRVPVAPCGDAACGGDDFDRALYDYAEADLLKTQGVRFSEEGVDLSFLLACRQVKERLSHAKSGVVRHFLEGKNAAYTLSVDRKTFESLIAPTVAHTAELAEALLRRVKEAKFEVDTVVLIGGSSRIPLVRESLGKAIKPLKPLATMHDDCAVAMGAVANISTSHPPKAPKKTVNRKTTRKGGVAKKTKNKVDQQALKCELEEDISNCFEMIDSIICDVAIEGTALLKEMTSDKRSWLKEERIKYLDDRAQRSEFVKEYLTSLRSILDEKRGDLNQSVQTFLHGTVQNEFRKSQEYLIRKDMFIGVGRRAYKLYQLKCDPRANLLLLVVMSVVLLTVFLTKVDEEEDVVLVYMLPILFAIPLAVLLKKHLNPKRIYPVLRQELEAYFSGFRKVLQSEFENWSRQSDSGETDELAE